MSGQITREIGQPFYLQAQLYDLDDSIPLRIIADVLDNDGVILSTAECTYVSKGTFVNDTAVMPNEPVVFVKYYVYEMNGTTLVSRYGVIEERYMLTTVIPGGGSSTIILGDNIEGTIQEVQTLKGELDTTEIEGSLEEGDSLTGTIDDIELEGVLDGES